MQQSSQAHNNAANNERPALVMDLQNRVEHLKRLRDEVRRQLRSGEGDAAQLRIRMIELAEQISDLEAEPRREKP